MKTITVTDYEYRFLVHAVDEYRAARRAEERLVPEALKPVYSEALYAIDQLQIAVVDAGNPPAASAEAAPCPVRGCGDYFGHAFTTLNIDGNGHEHLDVLV